MHIKLYLEVNDLKRAYTYYQKIFLGEDVKVPHNESKHASLKMFGKVTLLLHHNAQHQPSHQAYFVIRFEDHEVNEFHHAIANLQANLDKQANLWSCDARWGTTFWEFKDPFGFTWDLEINTSSLKQSSVMTLKTPHP